MKIEEIKVGGVYSNGKVRETVRQVTYLDQHFTHFENLKGEQTVTAKEYMRSDFFACWAHHEVKEKPAELLKRCLEVVEKVIGAKEYIQMEGVRAFIPAMNSAKALLSDLRKAVGDEEKPMTQGE